MLELTSTLAESSLVKRGLIVLIVVVSLAALVAAILIATLPELDKFLPVRTAVRWIILSHKYKAEVLAQPVSSTGELSISN
jgi:hypothetical protein